MAALCGSAGRGKSVLKHGARDEAKAPPQAVPPEAGNPSTRSAIIGRGRQAWAPAAGRKSLEGEAMASAAMNRTAKRVVLSLECFVALIVDVIFSKEDRSLNA